MVRTRTCANWWCGSERQLPWHQYVNQHVRKFGTCVQSRSWILIRPLHFLAAASAPGVKHDDDTTSVLSPVTIRFFFPVTIRFFFPVSLHSFTSLSLSSFSSSDVTLVPQRNERCVCWCSQQMATSKSWTLTPESSWILSFSPLL